MEMWSSRRTSATNIANNVALRYLLTCRHGDRRHVAIQGIKSSTVIDDDFITEVIIGIASRLYNATRCSIDWGSFRCSKIGTFMKLPATVDWISTLTIFTCDRILWIERAGHRVNSRIGSIELFHCISCSWKDGQEAKQDECQNPCHVSLYQK